MNRTVFLLHRYLGISLGLVMSVWCLSGVVMMYVQYPEMDLEDEARSLEPLNLSACCALPPDFEGADRSALDGYRVEMMAGRPVLRLHRTSTGQSVIDLRQGTFLGELTGDDARNVAQSFARVVGIGSFRLAGLIERDQWTVYGAYDVHRPLYKFVGDDDAGTTWYVSSQTGEVVQATTGSERFWNWLGAVPHWLYPTLLRQHTYLWSQIVIWLTIFGTFLTVLGLYVGIRQYKSRRSGRRSPYRGAALFHHYAGLFFGVLTLTWLLSGFFSMNPWGALESRSFSLETARYQGSDLVLDEAEKRRIEGLGSSFLPDGAVRLQAHVIDSNRFLVAWDANGERHRLDSNLREVHPITQSAILNAAQTMRPDVAVRSEEWIREDDAYYYDHHEKRSFPVYRIVYEDGERFYLDDLTGEVLLAVDTSSRWYRWLHYGLHRGDFAEWIRSRPVWDFVMLIFLAAVTTGALTGTWMGVRRLTKARSSSTSRLRELRRQNRPDVARVAPSQPEGIR
jgi:hypothetical protein